ncbi:hypothetical protein WMY93_014307 [Mugilogobius chulae]|uniref:Leishmanolysin-like peptidase n=1 Tax=Mugilogobius chulae TaxID=88201 RepID=A0AAW0NYU5_9GOBI
MKFDVSRPKCIFDEVQAQVRAVPLQQPAVSKEIHTWKDQKLQNHMLFKSQRKIRELNSPQPIRIRTWCAEESHYQPEEEKERLEAAVDEAVSTVSSLLSVRRAPGSLLLKRDINKYCKFLWRNFSSLNYNRVTIACIVLGFCNILYLYQNVKYCKVETNYLFAFYAHTEIISQSKFLFLSRCGHANKTYRNETCLDVTIPDEHLEACVIYPEPDSAHSTVLRPEGAGLPDTDFLLYLHVRATDKCRAEPDVQAYAVHCQTNSDGRPLAGVVVICREKLTGAAYNHHSTVQTLIHELFHALGFSKTLFGSWRDCSTSSHLGCSLRAKMIRPDASGQMRIYTPSVTSSLQKHLRTNDSDLGGPLENKDAGPSGISSHWESRLMQGSIMTAVLGDPSTVRIDPVTLAALQDTGWYTADLKRAQLLIWGEGQGNRFGSPSTCKHDSAFFCSGSGFGCHYLHLHKGQCQSDPYLDGCHIYKPVQNGSECWVTGNVQLAAQEVFGSDSRCFFSTLSKQSLVMNSSVVGHCYKHKCTGFNKYQIQVHDSDWVDCPAGGAIQIKGYQGFVWCPDKRLCVPGAPVLFSSHNTSGHIKSNYSRTFAHLTVSALVVAALTCFLLLVVIISCRCCKVRVHSLQHERNQHQTLP